MNTTISVKFSFKGIEYNFILDKENEGDDFWTAFHCEKNNITFDIHYCLEYNEIAVYEVDMETLETIHTNTIHSQPILRFNTYSIEEFNFMHDTTLTNEMTFSEAVDNIEEAENNYFYVSLNENDVLEAIENEKDIANQLDLNLVFISELGIYIALQH